MGVDNGSIECKDEYQLFKRPNNSSVCISDSSVPRILDNLNWEPTTTRLQEMQRIS